MIDDPRERVFHVDTECYIVYLGKEPDDYRPFLRIGSSPKLPEKAKNFIATVVVSDSHTGNLLIEHENLQLPLNGETSYVGDPEGVNRLKQFLEEKDLPVAGYVYEEREEDPGKGGAYVYFYRSGNLHIVRDGSELFDLRDREREDAHFVSRAERAVQLVKANPLRFVPQDFADPGFIAAGDRVYLFNQGRLGSASVSIDYIVHLAKYGIDPDLLAWMAEDGASEGLLARMKRAALSGKEIKVLTPAEAKLKSAVSVFAESALSCEILPCDGEDVLVSGFTVGREGSSFVCAFPKEAEGRKMSFEDGKRHIEAVNSFFAGIGLPGRGLTPMEGVPYRFLSAADLDPERLVRDYLSMPLDSLRDISDLRDRGAIKDLSSLAKTILSAQGSTAAAPLTDARGKPSGAPEKPEFYSVYWNARELARLFGDSKNLDQGLKRQASRFASLCPTVPQPERNTTQLPLAGDLLRYQDSWYLFYRFDGLVTPLKLGQAKKSAEGIEKLLLFRNEEFYEKERKRLLDFIDGLTEVEPANRKKIPVEARHPLRPSPEEVVKPEKQAASSAASSKAGEPPKPTEGTGVSGRPAPGKFSPAPEARPESTLPNLVPRKSSIGRGLPSWVNAKTLVPVAVLVGVGGASVFFVRSWRDSGIPASAPVFPETSVKAQPDTPAVITPPAADKTPASSGPAPDAKLPPPGAEKGKLPEAGKAMQPPVSPAASAKGLEKNAGAAGTKPQSAPGEQGKTSKQEPAPPAAKAQEGIARGKNLPIIDTGKISITIREVYNLVNEIAEKNNYRRLDAPKDGRPDPNLIYPGTVFVLPDGTSHTVVKGDTLWSIAARFLRRTMREQEEAYKKLSGAERPKDEVISELRKLRDASRSRNLKARFEGALKQIEEE